MIQPAADPPPKRVALCVICLGDFSYPKFGEATVHTPDVTGHRVRQALRKGAQPTAAPDPIRPHQATLALQPEPTANPSDPLLRLQTELTAVGGQVVRVSSPAAAPAYIKAFTRERSIHHVIRWSSDLLSSLEVDAILEQDGIEVHMPPEQTALVRSEDRQTMRRWAARVDLGISGVTYAIAETGTLALAGCACGTNVRCLPTSAGAYRHCPGGSHCADHG